MPRAVAAVDAAVAVVADAGVVRTANGHRLPQTTGTVRAKAAKMRKQVEAIIGPKGTIADLLSARARKVTTKLVLCGNVWWKPCERLLRRLVS